MSEALSILASSSSNWLPAVMAALEEMMELVNIAITPLLSEIAKNIEAIILNMHDVHSSLLASEGAPCPWSEELRSFVSRVVKDHFTTLVCKQAIMERLRGLSRRAVVQATTNVFLVKPQGSQQTSGDDGQRQSRESLLRSNLIKGLNELEEALAPLITSPGGLITVADCGQLLKKTKPLLLASPENILKGIRSLDSEEELKEGEKEVSDEGVVLLGRFL